jgi:perosamine synthetase
MAKSRLRPLPRYSTIGQAEKINVLKALRSPLSGYLGGINGGGRWVTRLEDEWREEFGCAHAVCCNSATSGLLASCIAAGIGPHSVVWTTTMSMSATASCALVLGAAVRFLDIECDRFGIDPDQLDKGCFPSAIIVTNLFGHPAKLAQIRAWADERGVVMIEDNAQSIFAMEGEFYAGTVGHVGVFSLNVHKHVQCGEGGVVVTNDDVLDIKLRGAINHGELRGDYPGLNLRMTEVTAAIACAQLKKARKAVYNRIELANAIGYIASDIDWIFPCQADDNCSHSYYVWPARIENKLQRDLFVQKLNERGVPMRAGYDPLLTKLFGSNTICPNAETINDQLILFETCAYEPRVDDLKRMDKIIHEVAAEVS